MSDVESLKNAEDGARKKKWWIAATVILFILALPVLVPAALAIGGVALGLVLALAGGGIAVIVGVGGGVLAGICCLVALLLCAVIGTGFGFVMLFSTPASGLAVLGMSLFAAGVGILGFLLVWQCVKFLIWAVRRLSAWLGGKLQGRGKDHPAAAIQNVGEEKSHEE